MNPSRHLTAVAQPPLGQAAGPWRLWVRFWFTPADPIGLHALRVLVGLLFLAWLLPFMGHEDALFGLEGWFDQRAYSEAARLPEGPPQPLGWSVLFMCGTNSTLLSVAYWAALGVLVLFTVGVWTRITAVLTWVVVVSFLANPAIDSDADCLLALLAFYLMIGYLLFGQRGRGRSLASRLLGPASTWLFRRRASAAPAGREPSLAANITLRLLQVHLAVVILTTGLHKLQFGDWWAGVAFWYPLHPPFQTTLESVRDLAMSAESYLTMLSVAAYLTLAWQIGFPLFAWKPRWRIVLLVGAVVGWLGSAFLYELPLLGPAIFVCCLCYLSPGEWHWLASLPGRLMALRRRAEPETLVSPTPPLKKKEEINSVVAVRHP